MRRLLFALAVLVVGVSAQPGETQKKPAGGATVRAVAKQPSDDGQQVIEVTMTISPGFHVYANPCGNKAFEPDQATVSFGGANRPKVIKIDYPPGKPMTDAGEKFQGYEGQILIRATVQRTGKNPLEMVVRFMACNENNCFPSKVTINVP